jgi:aspartate aminotransferase
MDKERTSLLNPHVQGLGNSPTLRINELSNKLILEGKEVFKLGLGQSPFPVPDSVQEALRKNAQQKDYLPVQGLMALREAVAAYHVRENKIAATAANVMIGPGSKELLFILQLAHGGDLLIPAPSWVSYEPQARIIGKQVHWLQTTAREGWRLQAEEIERHCAQTNAPALLILNYPNNPVGNSYSPEQLKAIADVCRKYGVIILSDEIYGELYFDQRHQSIASYYPEGTIVSAGLSKWCGAGGWRLGTFSFPEKLNYLLKAMCAVASETFTSVSAPIQYAAITAYGENPDLEAYRHHSRRILSVLANHISNILTAAKIHHPAPEGGFYLFVNFEDHRALLEQKGILNSVTLVDRILQETGVAMLPGSNFGRPHQELTVRLAYVNFDGEKALEAASKIEGELDEQFLLSYCPRTIEAIRRVHDWTLGIG